MTVTVPNVVGMTQAAATTAITGAGLKVGTVTTQSSSTASAVSAGQVISESPAEGTSVAAGSSVNLVVSSGPAPTGDVSLTNLIVPKQITTLVGRGSTISARAVAASTAGEVPATVKLSDVPGSGVKVSLTTSSITKELEGTTTFYFSPRIVCTQKGTWPVKWTAKISSIKDSILTNDVRTGTTTVICNSVTTAE